MKRKMIIPTMALVAIMGAIAMGTVTVSAQSPIYDNLVSKIAQRFNLKEEDVKQVVAEIKLEHKNEMKAKWEEKLNTLLSEGKITQAQKDAIVAKHTELEKSWEDIKTLSADERKTKMAQIQSDLKKWADEQKIDLKVVGLLVKPGFGHGFKMGHRTGRN